MNGLSHAAILRMGRYDALSLATIEPSLAEDLYRFMLRLRHCQLSLMQEYHPADEMRCPIHFCVGQESVPAALAPFLDRDDYLLSHHRSHGYFLAKGGSMDALFAEIYGKATGTNGGLAGSQELSVPGVNFFSGAIITGMTSIAVGVALAFKMQQNPHVVFTCCGDAATEEGAFWEAIAYAVLRQLPMVFICENNRYSTYSPQHKRQAADNIHDRVQAFGIESRALFGNDVILVHRTLREAIAHVRAGKGPFFIEAYTYRFNGHVGPEDDDYIGYRPQDEIDFWKAACPITLLEERMIAAGLLDHAGKKALEREIKTEVARAFAFAKQSAFPEAPDWQALNSSDAAPLADSLLKDHTRCEAFDHTQEETRPLPY